MVEIPESMDLMFFMDYLTHEVDAEDWRSEVENMVCLTPNGNIDMAVLVFDSSMESPKLTKWRSAMAWRLIDQYGEDALVINKPPIEHAIGN